MSNKKRHQLCASGNSIMEFNEIDEDYIPREWHTFEDAKSFIDFLSKEGSSLFEGTEILCISQKKTKKLLHLGVAPPFGEKEEIKEHIFSSKEDAENFIKKNKMLPSANLLDEDAKQQISKFFSNEKCFFAQAAELQEKYFKEKKELKEDDEKGHILLGRNYEQKIVNILIQY